MNEMAASKHIGTLQDRAMNLRIMIRRMKREGDPAEDVAVEQKLLKNGDDQLKEAKARLVRIQGVRQRSDQEANAEEVNAEDGPDWEEYHRTHVG